MDYCSLQRILGVRSGPPLVLCSYLSYHTGMSWLLQYMAFLPYWTIVILRVETESVILGGLMELMWCPIHNCEIIPFEWIHLRNTLKRKTGYISKDNLGYAVVTNNPHTWCLNKTG